jgi:hypothetical protein
MIFKSLVMKKCYFGILLVTKEGEDGTWWSQSLKCVLMLQMQLLAKINIIFNLVVGGNKCHCLCHIVDITTNMIG